MSVRMNFEHELETLRENMDAMGKGIQQAFADLLSAIAFNNLEELDRIQKNDRKINEMERKIEAECLLLLTRQQPVLASDLRIVSSVMKAVGDMERIGDHAENVADAARQRKEEGISISKEAQKELGDMLEMVNKIIRYAVEMFAKSDETHMQEIVTLEDQVDEKERELQKKHVERLTKGECSPEAGMIFSDIVSGLERVADHATNIAFAITTEEEMDEGKTN